MPSKAQLTQFLILNCLKCKKQKCLCCSTQECLERYSGASGCETSRFFFGCLVCDSFEDVLAKYYAGLQGKKKRPNDPTDELVTVACDLLRSHFPLKCSAFANHLRDSALFENIVQVLRSDSMQDVTIRHRLYFSVLKIICLLGENDCYKELLLNSDKEKENSRGTSVKSLLSDLATQADVFQKACLDPSEEKSQDLLVTESLARNIIRVNGILSKIVSPEVESTSYEEIMKPFMFQYVDLAIYNDEYRKFILDNIKVYKNIPHGTNRMNRIAKELATLSTSLPCSPWSSIFLRVDETRIDVLNALITGPVDTPYQNGCFEFDIFIPPDYPNSPPKVILITTGKGTVRFNPNLYNCGKVCLSLLGTWQGSREEMWNPSQSTLLQVLVSIQSLILVDLPYFNEPGYGIPRKELPQSQDYNRRVRHDCLKWAILDMLKNPPPIWEDVVFSHFKAKKEEIIMQCEEWKLLDKQVATVAKQITDILKSRKFKSIRN